jgi:hypothetical protein
MESMRYPRMTRTLRVQKDAKGTHGRIDPGSGTSGRNPLVYLLPPYLEI